MSIRVNVFWFVVRVVQASQVYFGAFCIGIAYMSWLLLKQKVLAGTIMVPINFMLFALFFRESFWYMQLKHKRLGMKFKDWISFVVLNNG